MWFWQGNVTTKHGTEISNRNFHKLFASHKLFFSPWKLKLNHEIESWNLCDTKPYVDFASFLYDFLWIHWRRFMLISFRTYDTLEMCWFAIQCPFKWNLFLLYIECVSSCCWSRNSAELRRLKRLVALTWQRLVFDPAKKKEQRWVTQLSCWQFARITFFTCLNDKLTDVWIIFFFFFVSYFSLNAFNLITIVAIMKINSEAVSV